MNDPLRPLQLAVRRGSAALLPLALLALVGGVWLAFNDGLELWRLLGMLAITTGAAFMAIWLRRRDGVSHPLLEAVRDQPERVRWIYHHSAGRPGSVLHVGLDDGQAYEVEVEDADHAREVEACLVAACPRAVRLNLELAPLR